MDMMTSNGKVEELVPEPIKVAIIDDDRAMRAALARLLKSAGIDVSVFSSAFEFLDDSINQQVDCVLTDLLMPDLDGLGLQDKIGKTLPHLSFVFITGHGNVTVSVKAMKSGAVDFLEKPVKDEALLAAVYRAAERSRALKASHEALTAIERQYARLTPRERQVLALIVAGRLNKQAASDLGIAEKTVKVHRARVMGKMRAHSLADLVRMAHRLGIGEDGAREASA